ncbi:MAG: 4-hydroxy-tetrahydrodipicolinate reductase [Deltaproteobacteria bacterium]|nr:4-hydroxy-tetrahydrodipicolinate reductase [Deltaproteobacteria bacterium]
MKIAINGALGRMGRMVIEAAEAAGDVEACCLFERPGHPEAGKQVATPWGDLSLATDLDVFQDGADVGIDYSLPDGAVAFIEACARGGIPVVSGTTGLSEAHFERIRIAAERGPVLWAANTSLGVFCLHEVSKAAARILGPSYDIEIVEAHHRHKRDAPSGTALSLAKALKSGQGNLVKSRDGETGPRNQGEIGIQSIRGGEIVGEHTVMFIGDDDRIEVTHRASSRRIFARGAIELARALIGRAPGLYTVADLLGS